MLERNFRRYFEQASKMPGEMGANLLSLVEHRLDTVVYRLGFARTRPMARQLVSHGHVLVNERRVNSPSYRVRIGDVTHLTARATEIPVVQEEFAMAPARLPSWLMREDGIGRVVGEPQRGEMDPDIRTDLYVEFYAARHYLWRAVDQDGQALDILMQQRRHETAAKRCLRKLLKGLTYIPRMIIIDQLASYGAAKRHPTSRPHGTGGARLRRGALRLRRGRRCGRRCGRTPRQRPGRCLLGN
jgi:ribosomal 50S subunit-recycling heat shock protein